MAVAIALLIGTCIVGIAVLFQIVGMSTTQWMKDSKSFDQEVRVGLFEQCRNDDCTDLRYLRSQDKAAQAMAILGVLAGGIGLIVIVVFVILTHIGKNPLSLMRIAAGLLCMAASGFIIICVIVYGAKIYRDERNEDPNISLGYSFGLSIVGGLLLLVGGGVIMANKGSQEERFTS